MQEFIILELGYLFLFVAGIQADNVHVFNGNADFLLWNKIKKLPIRHIIKIG